MGDLHVQDFQAAREYAEARFLAVGNMSESDYSLVRMLGDIGFSAEACDSGNQALDMLRGHYFHGVLCDRTLAGMSGIELLSKVQTNYPEVAFVMIEESGDVRQGVLAMIAGASGYLLKPLRSDELVANLHRALKRKRIERVLAKYRAKQGER